MDQHQSRPPPQRLDFDPAEHASDAGLVFIGRVVSPWAARADAPRNMRLARARNQPARIEIDEPYRPGLQGLQGISHLVMLFWFSEARRDEIARSPRHGEADELYGSFALRTPVRPNPIGVSVVQVTDLDIDAGVIGIDATDCLDGTPVLDLKPYLPSVDSYPEADPGWHGVKNDARK